MPKDFLDKAEVEIPCPQCGEQTKKSIAWLKAHDELVCPACGVRVHLDKTEFTRGLEKAGNALAKLRASMKRLE